MRRAIGAATSAPISNPMGFRNSISVVNGAFTTPLLGVWNAHSTAVTTSCTTPMIATRIP
jgi:hypothetical protein